MAQLVARLHGMQKVRGSNPLSSTQVRGQLDNPTGPFLMPVPQPVPQRPPATAGSLVQRRGDGAVGTAGCCRSNNGTLVGGLVLMPRDVQEG